MTHAWRRATRRRCLCTVPAVSCGLAASSGFATIDHFPRCLGLSAAKQLFGSIKQLPRSFFYLGVLLHNTTHIADTVNSVLDYV